MGVVAYQNDAATRLTSIRASLAAVLTARVVTPDVRPLDQRDATDLFKGVVAVAGGGEDGFPDGPGFEARGGLGAFALICDLQVGQDTDPHEVEDAELALVAEVKAWVEMVNLTRSLDCRVRIVRWVGSGQEKHPYGWVVFHMQTTPFK